MHSVSTSLIMCSQALPHQDLFQYERSPSKLQCKLTHRALAVREVKAPSSGQERLPSPGDMPVAKVIPQGVSFADDKRPCGHAYGCCYLRITKIPDFSSFAEVDHNAIGKKQGASGASPPRTARYPAAVNLCGRASQRKTRGRLGCCPVRG